MISEWILFGRVLWRDQRWIALHWKHPIFQVLILFWALAERHHIFSYWNGTCF
jgi:hypothetical protein